MKTVSNHRLNNYGMTLVEILVSLVLLGLILMAIFPLITQSLQVTNLSNSIATQLFGDQEDIEVVAATNGGVYFADGTFLPQEKFYVFFDGNPTPSEVLGTTVKKAKLIRFLASISHIKIGARYEGYSPEQAEVEITGYDTNFIQAKTTLRITDNDGDPVSCSFAIEDTTTATITLPVDDNRLTNLNSPYFVTLTTGNEIVTTLLPIHLPRAIVVKEDHNLLVSADIEDLEYWVAKATSSDINHNFNKAVFLMHGNEQNARFVAVGDGGSIYIWAYGKEWKRLNRDFSTGAMNSIFNGKDGLIAVGDGGVIYTSSDGSNWTSRDSKTSQNLQAISYLENSNKYVCVGDGGVILTSLNGTDWNLQKSYPRLAVNAINGRNAVKFKGEGDYLSTRFTPVTGGTERTVLMVASPKKPTASLLAWGSPLDTIEGGRFSFGIDSDGKLRVEQSGAFYSADLSPDLTGQASLLICCSTTNNFESYQLSMNGGDPHTSGINAAIDTKDYFKAQLGSDPLTRYIDPVNFEGLIAEVLIFDSAVNAERDPYPDDPNKQYASDFDLLRKYLSDKYGLGLTSLDGKNIADLIIPGSEEPLSTTIEDFPEKVSPASKDHLVLWLDASTLSLNDEQQVLVWEDQSVLYDPSRTHHHAGDASGAALLSVACNANRVVTGGFHRNLLNSTNTNIWNQTNQIDAKRITEFSLSNIVCTESDPGDTTEIKFVALLNDGFSSFTNSSTSNMRQNGLIAYSTNGTIWTLNDLSATSNHLLNDMFYSADNHTLLVVGNYGNIFTSSNKGESWVKIDADTSLDLLAACIR